VREHGHGRPASVRFVEAPETIGMGEHPATALRTKRRASIVVATDLVRDGDADAVVSAGSTGATMAAAVFRLGRIQGIDRPALPAHMVTATGPVMLLDVGANVDSDPENLVQFAAMGAIFAEHVLKVRNPRIGLLNIGEEREKGDELTKEAHVKLAALDMHFVGNIEAHDMIAHRADVVVCDGFVGNVVIKFFEGITSFIFRAVREDLQQGPIAPIALLALKPGFNRLKARFDYERYGGAPLLGVKGVSIVTHGRAKARMIENAIRVGSESAHARVPHLIAEWTREHPALAHRGVRSRIAARLHRERTAAP
jgi:glycerol-3-phosphate acyltransferase PlsX